MPDVTRAARGFAARLIAHGVRKGDKVMLWGENRPEWIACYWGIQLAGAVAVPIDFRSSQEFASRIRSIVGAAVVLAGDDVDPGPDAGVEPGRPRLGCRRPPSGGADRSRRRRADRVYVRRHRGAEGRRHPPSQHPRERRAGGGRDRQIQEIRAAVPADPVPEPAAAQPPVRPVDGHQHSPADRRHGRVHAQLQPARHCPPRARVEHFGDRLRAEDPRRVEGARAAHRCRRGQPAAGPVDTGALVALPPHPSHVRPEVLGVHRRGGAARIGSSRISGSGWASSSSRATGSPKRRRSSRSIIHSRPTPDRSAPRSAASRSRLRRTARFWCAGKT